MASVNWKKMKSNGSVSAILRHNSRDSRDNMKTHNNKEIDMSKTKDNVALTLPDSPSKYIDRYETYKKRIEHADATKNKNKRKDRVTAFALEFSVPEGMTNHDDVVEFGKKSAAACNSILGVKNFISCDIHFDEIHDYMDTNKKEMVKSRPHLHLLYTAFDEDDQLNGKKMSSRKNMVKLNKKIDEIAKEMGYQFMTGSKKKSTKSVEELKSESRYLEAEAELQKKYEVLKSNLSEKYTSKLSEVNEQGKKVLEGRRRLQNDIIELNKERTKMVDKYSEMLKELDEIKKELEKIKSKDAERLKNRVNMSYDEILKTLQGMYSEYEPSSDEYEL